MDGRREGGREGEGEEGGVGGRGRGGEEGKGEDWGKGRRRECTILYHDSQGV